MKRFKRILAIAAVSFLGFAIGAAFTYGSPLAALVGLLIGWGLSFFWPVINPNKFRREIKNQTAQIAKLEAENKDQTAQIAKLEAENKDQKEKLNKKMTILQMKPEELDNLIKSKEKELNNLIKEKQSELNKITVDYRMKLATQLVVNKKRHSA